MLATLDELKLYLGITDADDDPLLTMLLGQASSFIEGYCGRKFEAQAFSNELYDGKGEREFLLNNFPVNSLTSFQYNSGTFGTPAWEDFDADSYRLDKETGRIYLSFNLIRGPQNIQVSYNAGFTEIPKELEIATIRLAAYYYNGRTSDGIKSESVDGASITFDTKQIPVGIYDIIDKYKIA